MFVQELPGEAILHSDEIYVHVDNKTIESMFQILLKVPSEQSGSVSLKGLKQLLDWIFVKELRNKLFFLVHDYIDGP